MARTWSKRSLIVALVALSWLAPPVRAQDQNFQIGTSTIGELKYKPGFKHFDYVNPDAPKGGTLNLSTTGTFDTFNPLPAKGELADGAALVFETLTKSADDELLCQLWTFGRGHFLSGGYIERNLPAARRSKVGGRSAGYT